MKLPERVKIVEVGPRDGLQNEAMPVSTADKVAFIRALVEAGVSQIEAASFVHPKAIPQLADAMDVIRGLPAAPGMTYSALVPNQKGLDRAFESGIRRIAVFTAASDTFTKHNINMTVAESLATFRPIVAEAIEHGLTVRGYISTAFVCPFEGEIAPERVLDVTGQLLTMGVDEVAISDTIGAAAPTDIARTIGLMLKSIDASRLALHLHDTYGTALANVYAGLELGIATFDASAGGLGGCPYAPGAAGNLATEDLVYMLDRMGIETGVQLEDVMRAAQCIGGVLHKTLPSRQLRRFESQSSDTR